MTRALSETAKRAADNEAESNRRYALVSEGLAVAKRLTSALQDEEKKVEQLERILKATIKDNRILKHVINTAQSSAVREQLGFRKEVPTDYN